jgi:hypothetical protein
MNPLARLLPALITLLRAPALTWDGADVNVWEHLPGNEAGHYVLVEQATRTRAPGSTGCKHWSCTVLFRVITQFDPAAITNVPAETIAGQLIARLEGEDNTPPRLDLGPGYDCHPAELVLDSPGPPELDGELVAVTRLLRYRWEIYYSTPAADAGGSAPVRRVQSGRIRAIHS